MVVNLKTTNVSYFERSENLTAYYSEVRKHNILSQEEEINLFKILNDKNKNQKERDAAKEKLIVSNQRFVIAVAKRYATDDTLLDLIDEGNIGLIESIENFDINKGVRFMTWAVWYIRRAINFYLIDYDKMVKRSNKLKTFHVISQAKNNFIQKEERDPTLEELKEVLSEKYNIDIKNTNDLIDMHIDSIDIDVSEDDSENISTLTQYNVCSASENSYEVNVSGEFNKELIKSLLAKLKPFEAEVITLLFGINIERPLEAREVAERFGYTTERIRQLKMSILEKLKKEYQKAIKSI